MTILIQNIHNLIIEILRRQSAIQSIRADRAWSSDEEREIAQNQSLLDRLVTHHAQILTDELNRLSIAQAGSKCVRGMTAEEFAKFQKRHSLLEEIIECHNLCLRRQLESAALLHKT